MVCVTRLVEYTAICGNLRFINNYKKIIIAGYKITQISNVYYYYL